MQKTILAILVTFSFLGPSHAQQPLVASDFKGIGFAMSNLEGVMVDSKLEMVLNSSIWKQVGDGKEANKYASLAADQFLDWNKRTPTADMKQRFDIIAVNKKKTHAAITTFEDSKPTSYTVVKSFGQYTATPFFCELIREQTKSASFEEMATKAFTCNKFYNNSKLTDENEARLSEHLKVHDSNMKLLNGSPAKSMIASLAAANPTTGHDQQMETGRKVLRFFGLESKAGTPVTPSLTPPLNRKTSKEDIEDRQMLQDISEACGRLWNDTRSSTAGGTSSPAAPASGATVKK